MRPPTPSPVFGATSTPSTVATSTLHGRRRVLRPRPEPHRLSLSANTSRRTPSARTHEGPPGRRPFASPRVSRAATSPGRRSTASRSGEERLALVGAVDRLEAEAPHDRVAGAHAGTVDQAHAPRLSPSRWCCPGCPAARPGWSSRRGRPRTRSSTASSATGGDACVVHEGPEPERARIGLVDDRHLDLVAGEVGVVEDDAPVLEAAELPSRGSSSPVTSARSCTCRPGVARAGLRTMYSRRCGCALSQ